MKTAERVLSLCLYIVQLVEIMCTRMLQSWRNQLNYFKKRCKDFQFYSTNGDHVKSYKDIPGPKGFLGLGTLLLNYRWIIGIWSWDKMHESCLKKYKEYGPIVKERLLPGVDLLFLFEPDDIAKVMTENSAGTYPQRRSHLALLEYRKRKPAVYKTGGLIPTNGEEWWNMRSELQKGLSSPSNVRKYLTFADGITKEFVDACVKGHESIEDLMPDLERLNLELICLISFDVRMNAFHEEERDWQGSLSNRLIKAAKVSNSAILPLDQSALWRLIETPTYRKLRKSQEVIENAAINLVNQKISYFNENPYCQQSLLDTYLRNPKIDLKDIVGMACDLLLAGVDTSTYSTSFALYHIGRNIDVQNKLYEEAKKILPVKDDPIQLENFLQAVYTRAVLKESLRLNPIAIGVGRILNVDMVLGGYSVPKGTVTVVQTQVPSNLETYVPDADKFMPERWLNADEKLHPFVSLPFGHGRRACIARRFAEQNIMLFLIRLIRNYEIQWKGDPEMTYTTKLINIPDQKISISLKERTD